MSNKNIWMIILAAIALVALTVIVTVLLVRGTSPVPQPTATTSANLVLTSAAQTADARLTEIVMTTPSSTPVPPTSTPDVTQTVLAQTAEVQLTQVAQVTPSPVATLTSAPVATVSSADQAVYVKDVTIPDGTVLDKGASFTKTWRLKNAGTTTWTTSYSLVFISGDKMGDTTSASLKNTVAPGEEVDISVDLVASSSKGHYRGYWKMLNAAGQYFNDSVYVDINVGEAGSATAQPTGQPTATPTSSGGGGGDIVTGFSMSVDPTSYSGTCPHGFTFSASFTVNKAAALTYELEASSDTPGFQFNLPGAQTASFSTGTYTLSFPLEFSSSVTGWVRLHITGPIDITSNKADFSCTCQ